MATYTRLDDPSDAEHYSPFWGHSFNDTTKNAEPDDGKGDGNEKAMPFGSFGHRRTPPLRKIFSLKFLRRLVGWPGIVILGQLTLQTMAWGFFAVLQTKGAMAPTHEVVAWANAHPHTLQWISTQLSTILSFLSTLLFSWAIRQSITLHLRGDGMSLVAFISFIRISSGALILNRRNIKLSVMAVLIIILTGVQTAGWSALITPHAIVKDTPLLGQEIDLTSPHVTQTDNTVKDCVWTGPDLAIVAAQEPESGYTSARAKLGFPTTFTVMDRSFNVSTGGILPLTLQPMSYLGAHTIPVTIYPQWKLPRGLGSSHSLVQQGFTADVSCEFWKGPTDPSALPLEVYDDTVKEWVNRNPSDAEKISYTMLTSNCTNSDQVNWSRAYTSTDEQNYILMIACLNEESPQLVFYGGVSGLYRFLNTTVCTLTPRMTQVQVSYESDLINISEIVSNDTIANASSPATTTAVYMLREMVLFSQSFVSNVIGDMLMSLRNETVADPSVRTPDLFLGILEEYIRGVTEYSATVLRACLASDPNFTASLPSAAMRNITHGIHHTKTVGWTRTAIGLTFLQLLPGAIIALLTIYAVVVAVAHHLQDERGEYFDPSDAMQLVAASAAGGMDHVFTGLKEKDLDAAGDVTVYLGEIPGRGPGLLRNRSG
ncbi:hypothetical protein R3P38DRAFT_3328052 [Favolaschia claudopus]|uniref:Uncharacterized protein n=1 Tax=Favolaschia claudopus TaxID=2862362 RepID=A0AAW0A325_9AGAR